MEPLALLGGTPVLSQPLPPYQAFGPEAMEAVTAVMQGGCLSGFYGSWGDQFFGGPMVRALEEAWRERFEVQHAIAVNSATSGLSAAMGAIGLNPGDEVIIPPYTMSATAMAPLLYGGIPVFADIEPHTFCLDPQAVRQAITPRTRAILAVNLFGHPAPLADLMALAREHGLYLVEDNAQAPLAMHNGHYTGTLGHIGVFSLNYHKHIQAGEGGICVTNDATLAQRLQLIRNHGENVVAELGLEHTANLIGFNYRMPELSAAIALTQLQHSAHHVCQRIQLAQRLTEGVMTLPGLRPPLVRPGCRHVYYVWALRYDASVLGVSRQLLSQALAAEGFPHFTGYVRPLYMLPVFQQRLAFGNQGYPFNLSSVQYTPGMCPVAEQMYAEELLGYETCAYAVDEAQAARLVAALHKVYAHGDRLARLEQGRAVA
ncbi:MAG: DegT/DnrJ/EryC1/StrS family aminotransferase [Candidatus Tectimicrobiota bacterium]